MKKYQKILAVTAVFVIVTGTAGGYFWWKRGTPYETPYWSPNNEYYVQKYTNFTFSSLIPSTPGHGSDSLDGYVRLFDKNGNMLDEVFISYVAREIKPAWDGKNFTS